MVKHYQFSVLTDDEYSYHYIGEQVKAYVKESGITSGIVTTVVAHTNCGAQHMSGKEMVANMERLGVSAERIEFARHCGIDFDKWLAGFGDTEEAVRKSVDMVANHPVMPPHVRVIGFIMDSDTGKLSVVC